LSDPTFLSGSDRDRLIAAAAELSAESGYSEIDEARIARRAGLAPEILWNHFSTGKEECLVAAENAILLEVVTVVSRSYSADRSEWESMIHGVKAILELMAATPAFAYLGYVFSRQMAPGPMREITKTGHQMLEAMLERGWEYSDSAHQPAIAALGVLGGAQAIVRRELVAGRAAELPRLLPDFVYVATVPFLGQRESLRLAREAADLLHEPPG
jgi:AcrR family transcriptional regulator